MKNLTDFIKLMRPRQWFKSLFIAFGAMPAIFLMPADVMLIFWLIGLGIINMIMMQGVIYTINDISDAEKDKLHPKKKFRPIASGRISKKEGAVFAVFLFLAALLLAYIIDIRIVFVDLLLLANSFLYNKKPFKFREKKYLDVFTTAANFPLRVMVGWYLFEPFNQARFSLTYQISSTNIITNNIQTLFFNAPPRVIEMSLKFSTVTLSFVSIMFFTYFLACFLLFLKRYAEKNECAKSRATLELYSYKGLKRLASVSALLSLAFITALILSLKMLLLLLLPAFVYIMIWYYRLAMEKNSPVSQPEHVFTKSKKFILFTVLILILSTLILFA